MFLNICVTIAVVILIIYIYFRRKPSIKEGLGSSTGVSGEVMFLNFITSPGQSPGAQTLPEIPAPALLSPHVTVTLIGGGGAGAAGASIASGDTGTGGGGGGGGGYVVFHTVGSKLKGY